MSNLDLPGSTLQCLPLPEQRLPVDLLGLPDSVWKGGFRAEVRAAAQEQDRGAETLPVAVAADVPLCPLDEGVDALAPHVGDPEENRAQHAPQMSADGLGRPRHGRLYPRRTGSASPDNNSAPAVNAADICASPAVRL